MAYHYISKNEMKFDVMLTIVTMALHSLCSNE